MKLLQPELIKLVLCSFEAEKNGDIETGIKLLHQDFQLLDIWQGNNDELFPGMTRPQVDAVIGEVFKIKGREYDFITIMADVESQAVMIEFIESYPDLNTGQSYCTPQIGIYKIKDGKIWRSRHYTDPRLSYLSLNRSELKKKLV